MFPDVEEARLAHGLAGGDRDAGREPDRRAIVGDHGALAVTTITMKEVVYYGVMCTVFFCLLTMLWAHPVCAQIGMRNTA